MAVQERKNQETSMKKPVLDERFITTIQGKDFCIYAGLLDLAHQKGIQVIQVDVVQYPTKENGFEAIAKATVESKDGQTFIECGDANPRNVNPKISGHIIRMAATRAKARALRDFTNVGMTALEELGDPDDEAIGDEKPGNGRSKKAEPSKPESAATNGKQTAAPATGNGKQNQNSPPSAGTNGGSQKEGSRKTKPASKEEAPNGGNRENSGPKPSTAQIRAIENLARRRNITAQELEDMVQQEFGTTLPNINSSEASNFIRTLQQSA
ncbi:MAG: hypothetical protein ABSH41_18265 [Syntrophobacteraceae bacterium]